LLRKRIVGAVASLCRANRIQAGRDGRARRALAPVLWASAIVVLGAAADLATKAWAQSRLARGHDITLGGGLLRLQLVINHGAAFGLGARVEPALAVVSLLIVVALWAWAWAVRARSRLERVGAALAAAGGAGNLIDRLVRPPSVLHGGVVDWLHLSFYGPTFNLADVMLRGGIVVAAVAWLVMARRPAGPPEPLSESAR
jgi:signal peptidase II